MSCLEAAFNGDTLLLKSLGAEGADSYLRNSLFYASAGGHAETVSALLEMSPGLVESKDSDLQTALHAAALFNKHSVLRVLLESSSHTSLLEECDRSGRTALHLACGAGSTEAALLLLEHRAACGTLDALGRTALHYACQASNVVLMEALLVRDPKLALVADSEGVLPVHLACAAVGACSGKLIKSSPASALALDASRASCLHYAAVGGDVDLVNKLLSMGCSLTSVDRSGNTAMHFASLTGHTHVVAELLKHADGLAMATAINLFGDSPALLAAFGGHTSTLKLLLQHVGMPRVAENNDTLLHKAAFGGHTECVSFLLSQQRKPDFAIDARGSGGATALHKAAAGGNAEVVRMLLKAGASPAVRDEEDALPIHTACQWGRAAAAQVLHPLFPAPERTLQGATPLHLAAASGDVACFKFCLSVYKDSPVTTGSGFFAAHFAAKNGRVELVTEVLSTRLDLLEARTSEGLSVRDVAMACGNSKFAAAVAALSSNHNGGFDRSDISAVTADAPDLEGGESLIHDEAVGSIREQSFSAANQEMVNRAVALFNAKPQKGVQFLIQHKLVEDSPDSIAKFLFDTEALSKKKIGELISENDEGSQALANAFLRQLDFAGKDFDAAIRLFLSKFMLPGEAQKIDRVMEMFASRFYAQNPGSIFANADTCYVLAFAVIMLNTDLFNVSIKKDKKMTKQQWQSHVRGVNDGKDLPLDFVNDIYDRIRNNEIKMESETNMFARAGKKGFCMKQGGKIRTWKKRFFILSDHQLFYFKQATDESPLGIIPLENLTVEREDKLVKFGFRLSSTDGGFIKSVRMSKNGAPKKGNHTFYVMGASCAEEQVEWISTLQQAIHRSPYYELLMAKQKK